MVWMCLILLACLFVSTLGQEGGVPTPTPSVAKSGFFLATHFWRNESRPDGLETCLEPHYETMVRTGLCYLAATINPLTQDQSYMYDVQHNYNDIGDITNSTLYLLGYQDLHCSSGNYSGIVGSTVFTLNTCQTPINDNNFRWYSALYQFIPGDYPPSSKMPGPSATITGYPSSSACEANFPVSSQVSFRDGACIVDPGQGSPLGNAAAASNSLRYRCSNRGCLVDYFTDHHCLHPLPRESLLSNASLSLPPNVFHQQAEICQVNPVPLVDKLSSVTIVQQLLQEQQRRLVGSPSKVPTRRPTWRPTAALPTANPTVEPTPSAAPTLALVSDDRADIPLFSYAKSVVYAATIRVGQTFGPAVGKQNAVPNGYLTTSTYAGNNCNPSTAVSQTVDAVGVCMSLSDSLGQIRSEMLMVGWDGGVAVRRTVQFSDNYCIYEIASRTEPAVGLGECILTARGSVAYAYSAGPVLPPVSPIRPDVSSPVLRMYRSDYECQQQISATKMLGVLNGDCVALPGQGSASFQCSPDGSQITTTIFSDVACTQTARGFTSTPPNDPVPFSDDQQPTGGTPAPGQAAGSETNATYALPNPATASAPATCSKTFVPRLSAGTPMVYTAMCTSALYTQDAAHGVQGYVTTTYYSDAKCASSPVSSQSQAIGLCEAGTDATSLNLIAASSRKIAYIIESPLTLSSNSTTTQRSLAISSVNYQDSSCTAVAVIATDSDGLDTGSSSTPQPKSPTVLLDTCVPVSFSTAPASSGGAPLGYDDVVVEDKKAFLNAMKAALGSPAPSKRGTQAPTVKQNLPKLYSRTVFIPGPRLPAADPAVTGYTIDSFDTARTCLDPSSALSKIVSARNVYVSGACVLNTAHNPASPASLRLSQGSKRYSCGPSALGGYSLELFSDYRCSVPVDPNDKVDGAAGWNALPPACTMAARAQTTLARFRTAYCTQSLIHAPNGYAVSTLYSAPGCTGPVAAAVYSATGVCYENYANGVPAGTSYKATIDRYADGHTMAMRSSYSDSNCSTLAIDPVYSEFSSLSRLPQNVGLDQCTTAEGNPGMSQVLSYFAGSAVPFPLKGFTVTGFTNQPACLSPSSSGRGFATVATYRPGACLSTFSNTYQMNVGLTFSCTGASKVFQSPALQSASCGSSSVVLYTTHSSRESCAALGSAGTVSDLTGVADPTGTEDNAGAFSSEFCSTEPTVAKGFLVTTMFLGSHCDKAFRSQTDSAGQCLQRYDDDGNLAGSVQYSLSANAGFYTRATLTYSDASCSLLLAATEDPPVPLNLCLDTRDGHSIIATFVSGDTAPPPFIHGVQTSMYASNATCQNVSAAIPEAPTLSVIEAAGVCLPYIGLPGPWRRNDFDHRPRPGGGAGRRPFHPGGYHAWAGHAWLVGRDHGPHMPEWDRGGDRLWVTFDCSDGGVLQPTYSVALYNDSSCSTLAGVDQIERIDAGPVLSSVSQANPSDQQFDECVNNAPFPRPGPRSNSNSNSNSSNSDPLTWLDGQPQHLDNSADFDSHTCSRPPGTPDLEYRGFAQLFFVRTVFDNEDCSAGDNSDAMSQSITQINTCYSDLVSEASDGSLGSFMYMNVQSSDQSFSGPGGGGDAITIFISRFVDPHCVVPASSVMSLPTAPQGAPGTFIPTATGSNRGPDASVLVALSMFGPGLSPGAPLYSGPADSCVSVDATMSSYSYALLSQTINLASNRPLDIEGVSVASFASKEKCEDPKVLPDTMTVFAVERCLPAYSSEGLVVSSLMYSCEEADTSMDGGGNSTFKSGTYTITTYTDDNCQQQDVTQAITFSATCEPETNLASALGAGSSTLYRQVNCYPVNTPTPAPTGPPQDSPTRAPAVASAPTRPSRKPSPKPIASPSQSRPSPTVGGGGSSSKIASPAPSARPTAAKKPKGSIGSSLAKGGDGQGPEDIGPNNAIAIVIVVALVILFLFALKYYARTQGKTVRQLLFHGHGHGHGHGDEGERDGDTIPSAMRKPASPLEARGSEFVGPMNPIHAAGKSGRGAPKSGAGAGTGTGAGAGVGSVQARQRKVTFGGEEYETDGDQGKEGGDGGYVVPSLARRVGQEEMGVELQDVSAPGEGVGRL